MSAGHQSSWHVTQLGARTQLQFSAHPPRTARAAAASFDPALDRLLPLYRLNRGVLVTPFHSMALMCPSTTLDEVEALVDGIDACLTELAAAGVCQPAGG